MRSFPTKTAAYLVEKIVIFSKKIFFTSEYPLMKSVWIHSALVAIRLSIEENNSYLSSGLTILTLGSGAVSLFLGADLLIQISGNRQLGNYMSENFVPHSRYGLTLDRFRLFLIGISVHALVFSTWMIPLAKKHQLPLLEGLLGLYQGAGTGVLPGVILFALAELGQSYRQRSIIRRSALNGSKILMIEAETDHNGGLFPRKKFLDMLESLSETCSIHRIVAGSLEKLQQRVFKLSKNSGPFSLIWLRTHSWGNNESVGEGLYFSSEFSIEEGKDLKCLNKIMNKETEVILEGCSLAQKREDKPSFAEDLCEFLDVKIHSSSAPVVSVNIIWNLENREIELLDEDKRNTTVIFDPKKQK